MGNALGLELARFRKTNTISGCANDGAFGGFWLKRLPTADSESLPTVLVAAMPRYVHQDHEGRHPAEPQQCSRRARLSGPRDSRHQSKSMAQGSQTAHR